MTVAHLWALRGRQKLLLAAFAFTTIAAMPASAQSTGTAQSFVQDQYYLGSQGTPPSLSVFAENPRQFLRSEAAYTALRQRFAVVLGRDSLSEQEFQEILNSDQVRLRPCSDFGRFSTKGVTPTNVVVNSQRDTCYTGELFIEVLVNGAWVVAASQGCFNPVTIIPRVPAPPPATETCRWVSFSDAHAIGTHIHSDGTVHRNCCCAEHSVYTPGYSGYIPNTLQSSGRVRICE